MNNLVEAIDKEASTLHRNFSGKCSISSVICTQKASANPIRHGWSGRGAPHPTSRTGRNSFRYLTYKDCDGLSS